MSMSKTTVAALTAHAAPSAPATGVVATTCGAVRGQSTSTCPDWVT